MKNILELLERSKRRFPNKNAFVDEHDAITYRTLERCAKCVGSSILTYYQYRKTVAIFLDKGIDVIVAMMGVAYSGNIYTVIDNSMPKDRIDKIFSTLDPFLIITDESHRGSASMFGRTVCVLDEMKKTEIDQTGLDNVRKMQIDTDPLYILYTSGSTGIPKGTVISHRNVLAYSEWVVDTFHINEKTIIGNQTPFYFSMSVTDIYSTLRSGGTLVIIPVMYFSFPIRLVDYMNVNKVNMIYWVPSAFGIVANADLFEIEKPGYLKTVLFAGEVMPAKYLRYWMKHLGVTVTFANLFGPTETTDICTYYVVYNEDECENTLPIGRNCDNCDVFIINEEGKEAKPGEEGELYVRGSFLASGYYNDPEKTAEAFVQNPLNSAYPEKCYRTGDLVRLDGNNNILYIGRRDFQIKRMGYRIELGEIEAAADNIEGVNECACVFRKSDSSIIMFYSSADLKESEIMIELEKKINRYMMPDSVVRMDMLPHNQNGKIDRKELGKRMNDGQNN